MRPAAWALFGLFALAGVPAWAQTASESARKAAYLYNFVLFTEWPADDLEAGGALDICVADPPVAEALSGMVAGKSVGSHAVVVRRLGLDGTIVESGGGGGLKGCEVLYLGRLDLKASQIILDGLTSDCVLTVGDLSGFTRSGGIARFFVEGANLRFEINLAAAQRARLRISAKVLRLARIVKDE